jgi:hypothetical protein
MEIEVWKGWPEGFDITIAGKSNILKANDAERCGEESK